MAIIRSQKLRSGHHSVDSGRSGEFRPGPILIARHRPDPIGIATSYSGVNALQTLSVEAGRGKTPACGIAAEVDVAQRFDLDTTGQRAALPLHILAGAFLLKRVLKGPVEAGPDRRRPVAAAKLNAGRGVSEVRMSG